MSDEFDDMIEFFDIEDEEYPKKNGSGEDLFDFNDEDEIEDIF